MSAWEASVRVALGAFVLDVELDGDDGVLALVGPNGSGKTTLLRALVGALDATCELRVGDRVLASARQGIDLPPERRRIGYVPQGYGLFPHLSVLENVVFGLGTGPARRPREERDPLGYRALEELGCGALAGRAVRGLSGGEQQRVALARALVTQPDLLLLDEPLAALDATTRRGVRHFLAERLGSYGRPTVLVTHDVDDVEALGARICAIEAGAVVQRGTLDEVRAAPATPFVAELVGE